MACSRSISSDCIPVHQYCSRIQYYTGRCTTLRYTYSVCSTGTVVYCTVHVKYSIQNYVRVLYTASYSAYWFVLTASPGVHSHSTHAIRHSENRSIRESYPPAHPEQMGGSHGYMYQYYYNHCRCTCTIHVPSILYSCTSTFLEEPLGPPVFSRQSLSSPGGSRGMAPLLLADKVGPAGLGIF